MHGEGRFGRIPLVSIGCDLCHLESAHVKVSPVCCSTRQLWSAIFCNHCGVKGLLNVSVQFQHVAIFKWDENSPVAKMAAKRPPWGPT